MCSCVHRHARPRGARVLACACTFDNSRGRPACATALRRLRCSPPNGCSCSCATVATRRDVMQARPRLAPSACGGRRGGAQCGRGARRRRGPQAGCPQGGARAPRTGRGKLAPRRAAGATGSLHVARVPPAASGRAVLAPAGGFLSGTSASPCEMVLGLFYYCPRCGLQQ
jgi:hypothetical protein